jgi:peptidoglycan/LPS O-acetylase OafA/YrhL
MANPGHPSTHLPALDGLRGMAVLMVFICHVSETFWSIPNPWRNIPYLLWAGWTGVDLFFVLSGFLITGILWENRAATHYFRNFYARRTLRLFPLYYTALVIIFLVIPLLVPIFEHRSPVMTEIAARLRDSEKAAGYWPWFFTYNADFLFTIKNLMFPGQFWSLAVEEHFYLMWPLLIHRLSHGILIKVTSGIVIGTLILRVCLYHFLIPYGMYCFTFCRMDGLAMGALIALIMRNPDGIATLTRFSKKAFPIILVFCAALLLYQRGVWNQYGFIQQTIGFSLTPAFYACLLIAVLTNDKAAGLFSNRTLRFLGKYSYAIYIIHPFVMNYIRPLFSRHYSIVAALIHGGNTIARQSMAIQLLDGVCFIGSVIGITMILALISWKLIEQPFLNLKKYFPYEKANPADGSDLVMTLAENTGAIAIPEDVPPG